MSDFEFPTSGENRIGFYVAGTLVVLLILGIIALDGWWKYTMTKEALIDLTGKEPKPGTVIAIMMNGGK